MYNETVNEITNNFTVTGSKQKVIKDLPINKKDCTYHLHLVDVVGNTHTIIT